MGRKSRNCETWNFRCPNELIFQVSTSHVDEITTLTPSHFFLLALNDLTREVIGHGRVPVQARPAKNCTRVCQVTVPASLAADVEEVLESHPGDYLSRTHLIVSAAYHRVETLRLRQAYFKKLDRLRRETELVK